MTVIDVPVCQCPLCQQETEHAERERHRQLLLVFGRLDENQRRWFVALESKRLGHGGDRLLSQLTGLDERAIRRGRAGLDASLTEHPAERSRRAGDVLPVEPGCA